MSWGPFQPIILPLRPPRLAIEGAELTDLRAVGDHEEAPRLVIAAVGGLDRGLEDESDVRFRNGLGLELPGRALGEDRLAQRHGQPVSVHTLNPPVSRAGDRRPWRGSA